MTDRPASSTAPGLRDETVIRPRTSIDEVGTAGPEDTTQIPVQRKQSTAGPAEPAAAVGSAGENGDGTRVTEEGAPAEASVTPPAAPPPPERPLPDPASGDTPAGSAERVVSDTAPPEVPASEVSQSASPSEATLATPVAEFEAPAMPPGAPAPPDHTDAGTPYAGPPPSEASAGEPPTFGPPQEPLPPGPGPVADIVPVPGIPGPSPDVRPGELPPGMPPQAVGPAAPPPVNAPGVDLAGVGTPAAPVGTPVAPPAPPAAPVAKPPKEKKRKKAKSAVAETLANAASEVKANAVAAAPAPSSSRQPRRAQLRMTRVDPWSVMKTAFLLSIALGIVTIVAVFMVWTILGAAGVWDSINSSVANVIGGEEGQSFNIENYVGTARVLGFTMLVAVIDVVLLTAIATLMAFLYNMAAALLGGIDITLAEDVE